MEKKDTPHIVIDNPLSLTSEECQHIIEKASEDTKIVMMGYDMEQEMIIKGTGISSLLQKMKNETNISFIDIHEK